MRYSAFTIWAAAFAVLLLSVSTLAAQDPQQPFGTQVERWQRAIQLMEQELGRSVPTDERAAVMKERVEQIRSEVLEAQQFAEAALKPIRSRADALGPPPGEDDPPEVADIAQQRQELAERVTFFEGRVKQAKLITQALDEVGAAIEAGRRGRAIAFLLTGYPFPLAPSTLAEAGPDVVALLTTLGSEPGIWWASLGEDQKRMVLYRIAVGIVLALLLALSLRFVLRRWFHRDPTVEQPTYTRRLYNAVAHGLAFGIVPAALFGAFFYRVAQHYSPISGNFAQIVEALCIALIFFILACALPRAALAPALPYWQVVSLPDPVARAVTRRITFVAGIFALDLFFQFWGAHRQASDAFLSLHFLVINSLEAIGILILLQGWIWRHDERPATASSEEDGPEAVTPQKRREHFATGLRVVLALIAVGAIGASLLGYGNLGSYLADNLLFSAAAVGLLFLLRGLFREIVGFILRSAFLREGLALRHVTRQVFKFWLRVLLDIAIATAGVFAVMSIWGLPVADFWAWTAKTLSGFQFGDVTISITDIFAAIVAFFVALFVTRLLQQTLAEQILPRTRLDAGLSHSLSQGFGYLGLIVAFALAIAALGLNLTNLALIFGALSVGIGFGLQNVVNNFVSGIILLVERPIKVGDWVVVGLNEGFVKRIRLRSTEIETFQRASVVIPNAEIVSNSITNWTHRDRYGRVDVPVKVAFGSDIDKVNEVLMACLKEHEMVLTWPAPFVLFRRYGEDALEFEARGFLSNIEYIFIVQSDLLTAIDRAFREAGIEIPYPQRELRFRDAEAAREALDARGIEGPKAPSKAQATGREKPEQIRGGIG